MRLWWDRTMSEVTLICAACGYQWDQLCDMLPSYSEGGRKGQSIPETFSLNCPTCESNTVHQYAPDKQDAMGEDYDGNPWY